MSKPIIGFSDYGHLGTHSAEASKINGFEVTEKIEECDIVYISPDRPSDVSPEEAVEKILPRLKKDAILVVLCQVDPGFTRTIKWPTYQLYYQVETLKINDEALERALNPERIIIGDNEFIDVRYLTFLQSFNCPILHMSYESAELSKIAINLYLVAQLETTNKLAKIAEEIGANWNDIIPALQSDKRIGQHAYLKPGNGIGPHLQRDVDTVAKMALETQD
jgi:UDPglucose 6-dehydrogenase